MALPEKFTFNDVMARGSGKGDQVVEISCGFSFVDDHRTSRGLQQSASEFLFESHLRGPSEIIKIKFRLTTGIFDAIFFIL